MNSFGFIIDIKTNWIAASNPLLTWEIRNEKFHFTSSALFLINFRDG